MSEEEAVDVESPVKLAGFAKYLGNESHPSTGPRTFGAVYHYRIPAARLDEALKLGAKKR
jgi:hypothetical protein